nr:restriction endonuclease subunit S [Methanosphaera sp. BMS]
MPELRYDRFKEEWEEKYLKDVCVINPKTEVPEVFNYIDLESVNSGILTDAQKIRKNDAPSRAQRKLDKKDILFATVRPYQQNNYYFNLDGTYVASTGYAQIKAKENSQYLYYFLHTKQFLNEVMKRCTGTSYPAINSNDLKTIKIKIPSNNEQKKIASVFSYLDQKIELMEKTLMLVKKYQNETIKNIFDKQNYPDDWKKVSLNDLGTFYRGLSYNKEEVVEKGNIVLRSNNIKENQLDFSSDELQYVSKDIKPELMLQKKDIVICMNNGSKKLVGKSAEYNIIINEPITVGAFCSIFRPNNKLSKFLFRTETYKRNIYYIIAGSNINNLKNSEMGMFNFYIPTDKEEENKLFSLLTNIDKKYYLLEKEIVLNKQLKKSLLSKMFC